MGCPPSRCSDYADEPCVVPSGLGRSWSLIERGEAASVIAKGRLVVTFNQVGLAAAVAGPWRCAGWFGSFLEVWPGRIGTLNGASVVTPRFEMKLRQASESCNR